MTTRQLIGGVGGITPPYTCKNCGEHSWLQPSDQKPSRRGICHVDDHGTEAEMHQEARAWGWVETSGDKSETPKAEIVSVVLTRQNSVVRTITLTTRAKHSFVQAMGETSIKVFCENHDGEPVGDCAIWSPPNGKVVSFEANDYSVIVYVTNE